MHDWERDESMTVYRIADQELEEWEHRLRGPLSGYLTRTPHAEETRKLIMSLQAEFNELTRHDIGFNLTANANSLRRPSFLKQCASQLQTYGKSFWLASLMLFTMLTLLSQSPQTIFLALGMNDLFSLIVPLSLLTGVVYSHRTSNREMKMVESIAPFPPALIFLSRMMIVLGLNLLLGLVGSLYLYVTVDSFMLLPFLLHWIGPLLLLVGIVAFVMFWKGTTAGLIAGIGCWALWVSAQDWIDRTWQLSSAQTFYGLQLGMIAVGLLLLLLVYRKCVKLPLFLA